MNILIILVASSLSIVSFIYYLTHGYVLAYYDAISHLNIAREAIDSLTPGVVQLGSVWLPLPHLLMVPFIWNNTLWHTGIAGSVVSMISYVVTVLYSYKTVKLLTQSNLAGIASASIIGLNPNFLYMQATPMTESLALATISLYLYYLLKWSKDLYLPNLITAAFFVFLATLTRYEAWFLVVFGMIYIFWIAWRKKSYIFAESSVILYSVLAFFGIFLWIMYNSIIMGNPLYFLNGSFSAKAQQDTTFQAGALPTKYNLPITLAVYTWNSIDVIGILVLGAALISGVLYFWLERKKESLLFLLVSLGPPMVIILTLFLGVTVINVPEVAVNNVFGSVGNTRYALMSLPFIALTGSLIVSKFKYLAAPLFLIIFLQAFIFYQNNNVLTLNDPLAGKVASNNSAEISQTALTIHNHCADKITLMMISAHGPELLESSIDIKRYIYEGNYGYWQEALKDPTKMVTCIVMKAEDNSQDLVRSSLYNSPVLNQNYRLILKNNTDLVYQRID